MSRVTTQPRGRAGCTWIVTHGLQHWAGAGPVGGRDRGEGLGVPARPSFPAGARGSWLSPRPVPTTPTSQQLLRQTKRSPCLQASQCSPHSESSPKPESPQPVLPSCLLSPSPSAPGSSTRPPPSEDLHLLSLPSCSPSFGPQLQLTTWGGLT